MPSLLCLIASLALLCSLSLVFGFARVMSFARENHGAFLHFSSVAAFFLLLMFMLNFLLLFCLRWGIFKRDRDRDIVFSDCVCDDMSVFHGT